MLRNSLSLAHDAADAHAALCCPMSAVCAPDCPIALRELNAAALLFAHLPPIAMPSLPPIVDGAVSDDIPDLSVPLSDLASSRRSSMGSSIFNLDHVSIDYFQDYSDSQLSALSISDIPDRDLPLFTGSDQSLHQLPFDEHLISNPCDLPALENSTSFTKSRSSQSSGPISPISLADGVQPPTNASPTLVAPKAQQQKRLHSHILPNGKKDSRPRNHVCKLCNNRFLRRQDLFRHESTHSAVKNFVCPNDCGASFGRSDGVTRHLRKRSCSKMNSKD